VAHAALVPQLFDFYLSFKSALSAVVHNRYKEE